MARNRFGGDAATWFASSDRNGNWRKPTKPVKLTFWSGTPADLDRMIYDDLRAIDDPETKISEITGLANGTTPEFYGPDDSSVTRMWASTDGGVTGTWITTTTVSKAGASGRFEDLEDAPTVPTSPEDIGAATADQGAKADAALPASEVGAAGGVAPLDEAGKLPESNVPERLTEPSLTATFVMGLHTPKAVGDGITDDTAAFVAAATAAVADGHEYIIVQPGHYHCPEMNSDDMFGVYIVGDGVTFTPTTYVAAFTRKEWQNRGRSTAAIPSGRGAIALEVDDALDEQWKTLFPLVKELDIPIGVAWPTDTAAGLGKKWVKEAFRHGWELLSHGTTHVTFSSLTEAEVIAQAEQSRDAIAAITGRSDNIPFVYPEHSRTEENDRVLSKYFTRGRGLANELFYPKGAGHDWLVAAMPVGTAVKPDNSDINDHLKEVLRAIAATDSRMLMYFHWLNTDFEVPLRKLVALARSLGIAIVKPGDLLGSTTTTADPYFENTAERWVFTAPWAASTDDAYKGTTSAKFAHTETTKSADFRSKEQVTNAAGAGYFAVYRASFRYKAASDIALASSSGGLVVRVNAAGRTQSAYWTQAPFGGGFVEVLPRFPGAAAIPASPTQWTRVEQTVIIGPDVMQFIPQLQALTINGNQDPLYVDEFKFDLMDRVSSLRYTATLNGTTAVTINTGIVHLNRYGVAVTPLGAVAGRVYVSPDNRGRLQVFSTDAADTGIQVSIVVSPTHTWADNLAAWRKTGA